VLLGSGERLVLASASMREAWGRSHSEREPVDEVSVEAVSPWPKLDPNRKEPAAIQFLAFARAFPPRYVLATMTRKLQQPLSTSGALLALSLLLPR
jgi:hypothetical protein